MIAIPKFFKVCNCCNTWHHQIDEFQITPEFLWFDCYGCCSTLVLEHNSYTILHQSADRLPTEVSNSLASPTLEEG